MNPSDPVRRYDRKAAAAFLYERYGIVAGPKTLANYSSRGEGPRYSRIGNGRVVYAEPDLIDWAESRIGEPVNNPTEERNKGVRLPLGTPTARETA